MMDHTISGGSPAIQRVNLPKSISSSRTSKDNELLPIKGGVLVELETINPDKLSSNEFDSHRHSQKNGEVQMIFVGDTEDVNDLPNYILAPSYASWFDYKCIHQIEQRALPEFFNNTNRSKNPHVYIAYRNFMIDAYRLNPTEYLTLTACRRHLAGDVSAIFRVHNFLEQWGLINYHVDPSSRPSPMAPPSTSHFTVFVDSPAGLQALNHTRSSRSNFNSSNASSEILNPLSESSKTKSDGRKLHRGLTEFGLHVDQYELRNRIKATEPFTKEWDEQELLLLLEAVEMFQDDWNKVSEHVGNNRSQDECILQFLRLPIEDPYLEDSGLPEDWTNPSIPFSKSPNPIMTTMSFLASVVDPRVAAAAAKAAMNEFAKLKEESHHKAPENVSRSDDKKPESSDQLKSESKSPRNFKESSPLSVFNNPPDEFSNQFFLTEDQQKSKDQKDPDLSKEKLKNPPGETTEAEPSRDKFSHHETSTKVS